MCCRDNVRPAALASAAVLCISTLLNPAALPSVKVRCVCRQARPSTTAQAGYLQTRTSLRDWAGAKFYTCSPIFMVCSLPAQQLQFVQLLLTWHSEAHKQQALPRHSLRKHPTVAAAQLMWHRWCHTHCSQLQQQEQQELQCCQYCCQLKTCQPCQAGAFWHLWGPLSSR